MSSWHQRRHPPEDPDRFAQVLDVNGDLLRLRVDARRGSMRIKDKSYVCPRLVRICDLPVEHRILELRRAPREVHARERHPHLTVGPPRQAIARLEGLERVLALEMGEGQLGELQPG